ncbi:MAG: hypothetical protein H5T68_01590 [Chloroflexi bacterium]|nr:hypothetical protein [Chloroflexota bacterium]
MMEHRRPGYPQRDILYLIETLLPQRNDKERLVEAIKDDPDFIEAMLGDERLFDRIMKDETILLQVTPKLFFSVLLRQARKDLRQASYTIEFRSRQKIPVFDTEHVVDLLQDRDVCEYLAEMLASFTRIESYTWPVRVRKGVWFKYRFNELDVDSLIRLCQSVEEDYRFSLYKRIADVCLFLTGMFPEYVQAGSPTPESLGGKGKKDLEEYEEEGKQFYKLAAQHEGAIIMDLKQVLDKLAESFTLAEKPLKFLSEHYLHARKHQLFGI